MNLSDTDQAPYSAPAPQTATVSDEAVQAALDEYYPAFTPSESAHDDMRRALTAALPHLALSAAPCSVEVEELEWEYIGKDGLEHRVKTSIGTYSCHIDEDSAAGRMFCYLHLTEDGDCTKYGEGIYSGYDDYENILAAAQADFERRILSQIVTKPVDVAAVRRRAIEEAAQVANHFADHSAIEGMSEEIVMAQSYIAYDVATAIRALPPAEPVNQWQPTHRHVKRGTEYQLIGIGKMQAEGWATYSDGVGYSPVDMREVAIYRGDDGQLWVRPVAEINDGRFAPIPAAPASKGGE